MSKSIEVSCAAIIRAVEEILAANAGSEAPEGPPAPPAAPAMWELAVAGPLTPWAVLDLPGVPDVWTDWTLAYRAQYAPMVGTPPRIKLAYFRSGGEWPFDSEYQFQNRVIAINSDAGLADGARGVIPGIVLHGVEAAWLFEKKGAFLTIKVATNAGATGSLTLPAQQVRLEMRGTQLTFGPSPKDVEKGRSIAGVARVSDVTIRVWGAAA